MSTQTTAEPTAGRQQYPEQHAIPRGLGLVTSLGPGLVLAMTFLGAGDLVSFSVSGANYGYALLRTLVLSLIARTLIISAIAKYTLMNRFGDTQILEGFKRILPGCPASWPSSCSSPASSPRRPSSRPRPSVSTS